MGSSNTDRFRILFVDPAGFCLLLMDKYNWQRLKNLSLFKLWVTDRELKRWLPLVALLSFVLLLATAVRWFLFHP